MPPILMLGRFLPKLHSIRDSIPETFTTQIHCVAIANLAPETIIPLIEDKEAQIAIIDLSSYSQDVDQLLAHLPQNELSRLEIVVIHHYEGAILAALKSRFPRMHFRSLQEVDTQLLSLLLVLSYDCLLLSK